MSNYINSAAVAAKNAARRISGRRAGGGNSPAGITLDELERGSANDDLNSDNPMFLSACCVGPHPTNARSHTHSPLAIGRSGVRRPRLPSSKRLAGILALGRAIQPPHGQRPTPYSPRAFAHLVP
jgi:hypothetical protein